MVGDSDRDILAGIDAGCTPIFLTNSENTTEIKNIREYKKLSDFVKDEFNR